MVSYRGERLATLRRRWEVRGGGIPPRGGGRTRLGGRAVDLPPQPRGGGWHAGGTPTHPTPTHGRRRWVYRRKWWSATIAADLNSSFVLAAVNCLPLQQMACLSLHWTFKSQYPQTTTRPPSGRGSRCRGAIMVIFCNYRPTLRASDIISYIP